jgi:hypothetical protein
LPIDGAVDGDQPGEREERPCRDDVPQRRLGDEPGQASEGVHCDDGVDEAVEVVHHDQHRAIPRDADATVDVHLAEEPPDDEAGCAGDHLVDAGASGAATPGQHVERATHPDHRQEGRGDVPGAVELERAVGIAGRRAGAPEEERAECHGGHEDERQIGPRRAGVGRDASGDEGDERDAHEHGDGGVGGVGDRHEHDAHREEHDSRRTDRPAPGTCRPGRPETADVPTGDEAQRPEDAQVMHPPAGRVGRRVIGDAPDAVGRHERTEHDGRRIQQPAPRPGDDPGAGK